MSTEHTLSNTAPPWHGVFTANGDGQFLYQSDAYRVAFDRTGRLLSLRVNGHEFLSVDGTELAGGCFVADGLPVGLPHINLQADTAALVNGHAGIFLQATPDRLQLDLGHENPLGYQDLVVFPADDVVITPLEHAVMREQRRLPAYTRFQCAESAMRWTAPDGTAIEWQYAAAIVPDYHGRRAMIISVPFGSRLCGEIRFPASVWAADAVDITLTVGAPDHCFAAGAPIAVQGTVARKAETATVIELTLRISDLNT
ncbi:MAG TPA: hypothetical protein PKW60_13965, partial [Candidatus Hydrogenedentes bacterium]|nr:hypothetical protein [Candidatus Hydrogenedentota bacterium]